MVFDLGGGTIAASFSKSSWADRMMCEVPSSHEHFILKTNLSSDTHGLSSSGVSIVARFCFSFKILSDLDYSYMGSTPHAARYSALES